MNSPKVSVILPTYNAAMHLGKAIDSILEQTFKDFELIIINDGSSDDTMGVLAKYTDPRIVVITQENLGLPKALNKGISAAKGIYLARQDADDISHPQRLQLQVHFLDQYPSYGLVGSWTQIVTPAGATSRQHTHPEKNGQLQIQLLFNNQFVHSSVMLRACCLKVAGNYSENPEHFPPEDYDLWLRIARHFQVANIPEILLEYLELPTSISRTKEMLINDRAAKMAAEAILCIPGLNQSMGNINAFIEAANGRPVKLTLAQYLSLRNLVSKIQKYINKRFPDELSEIAKGAQYLRTQINKALIKSFLRRITKIF
jgi:glycosyltransferase involved in cell wall biosynthesis